MAYTIVIIDDNPSDAKVMRLALARADPTIEAVVLDDGPRALEHLNAARDRGEIPGDLILLDLNLPRLDGIEILQSLKADPELSKIPVIMLSGSNSRFDVERAYAAHANSYICKPTGIDELFDMVVNLVSYWFEYATLPRTADTPRKLKADAFHH